MHKYAVLLLGIVVPVSIGLWTLITQTQDILIPSDNNPVTQASEPDFYTELSLQKIFTRDKTYMATLSAERIRILHATGDVLPARTVNTRTLQYGDFTWAWTHVASQAARADITYINLETPLISQCPKTDTGMIFCGDSRHVEGLLAGGVDVVNLANNHTGNHGQSGIDETVALLRRNGMKTAGIADYPIPVITIRGIRFAFLGYTDIEPYPGINRADTDLIKKEITQARALSDVVIVQFHFGAEYQAQPDSRQKELARAAVDNGADLVIGNHPHWIQPIEVYNGRLITYAHGNFIFDQMWSQETSEGVMGRYYFYDDTLIDVEYMPLEIVGYGQARWLEGAEKERILQKLQRESEILAENGKN